VTGIDTNVLLRFILKDDPIQTPQARALFQSLSSENPGWISLASVLEIVWVLSSRKNMDRVTVSQTISDLLFLDALIVEQADVVASAIEFFNSSRADFADCLILASVRVAGCSRTVTFDQVAARDLGMELLGT